MLICAAIHRPLLLAVIATFGLASSLLAQPHPDLPDPQFDFNTFFVTRPGLTDPRFEQYLADARPEIVQVGYYGPMLHGYGDAPGATGYPMNLPAQGVDNLLAIYKDLNATIHRHGLKAIGHFQTGKVIGTWQDNAHFYDFYTNHWDEALLGPKPHPDVLQIVQRDAQGNPLEQGRNANTTYVGLCLSSPHTRQMLKQMLKVAIDAGVDGVMTNYNYRWDCVCPYCQASFRTYLKQHHDPDALATRFGIHDIDTHTFDAIPASIPGYPTAEDGQPRSTPASDPFAWEAKQWGAAQFKDAFDDIFIEYGRSLKPDLIIATWNHIGNIGHKEERTFLPADRWGRGENYFWYSGGAAFVGKHIDLHAGEVGDAWLLCHYLREMGDGKPFILGKYDRDRMRTSIAEGVATGGGGMGRYMRFLDPLGYEYLTQYTRFVHDHRQLYDHATPHAECALVLPRQSVQAGFPESLATFRAVGESLVRDQQLIKVLADQKLTAGRLAESAIAIYPDLRALTEEQYHTLRQHAETGQPIILIGDFATHDSDGSPHPSTQTRAISALENVHTLAADALDQLPDLIAQLTDGSLTQIDAPWTVRAAMYHQPDRRILHLVNYKYDQAKYKTLGRNPGPEGELPVAEHDIAIDLPLPAGRPVTSVVVHTPEASQPRELPFTHDDGRLRFTLDQLLIYAVIEIRHSEQP